MTEEEESAKRSTENRDSSISGRQRGGPEQRGSEGRYNRRSSGDRFQGESWKRSKRQNNDGSARNRSYEYGRRTSGNDYSGERKFRDTERSKSSDNKHRFSKDERSGFSNGKRDYSKRAEGRDFAKGDRRNFPRGERNGFSSTEPNSPYNRERVRQRTESGEGAQPPRTRPRHNDPAIPEHIAVTDLNRAARLELKALNKENAEIVAKHLAAAAELLPLDPEAAHQHALAAARRGGRIAVVRETLAITAYELGDFALALRELRTYRRLSGRNDQLALMVDSERGVGRPDRALELGRSVDRRSLPVTVQVGVAIAMSGARLDLGQPDLALSELEIVQLDATRAFSYSPQLFSAYAEVLDELGREPEAQLWRERATQAADALAGSADTEEYEVFELGPAPEAELEEVGTHEPTDTHGSADPQEPTEADTGEEPPATANDAIT